MKFFVKWVFIQIKLCDIFSFRYYAFRSTAASLLFKILPVEAPVLDSFCDMFLFYFLAVVEIGDRARDLEYFAVCARRKPEFIERFLQEGVALFIELAEFVKLSRRYAGV